jgi:hypothetical protein
MLRYKGRMLPNFELPPVFGVVAARAAAYRQFRGMVDEINRRAALAARPCPSPEQIAMSCGGFEK